MERTVIETNEAPKPVGPYGQAVVAGGFAWVSMQLPLDPSSGEMVVGSLDEQTRRALENLRAILYASGSSLSQVVKVTAYFTDLADFDKVNRVYAEFFSDARPARAALQAAALPKGARVAFDAVAQVNG